MAKKALSLALLLVGHPMLASAEVPQFEVPTIRTPRASWSTGGWAEFQWGMGPGDVTSRLSDATQWLPSKEFRSRTLPPSLDPMSGVLFTKVAEKGTEFPGNAMMFFGEQGLYAVRVDSTLTSRTKSEHAAVFASAKKRLNNQYGRPTCGEFDIGQQCKWRTPLRDIYLSWTPLFADLLEDSHYTEVALEYTRPGSLDPNRDRLSKSEVSHRIDPKKWWTLNLEGMRLGMGIGDAVDRIQGSVQPGTCSLACEKLRGPNSREVTVKCQLAFERSKRSGDRLELYFDGKGVLEYISFNYAAGSAEDIKARYEELVEVLAPLSSGSLRLNSGTFTDGTPSKSAFGNRGPEEFHILLHEIAGKKVVSASIHLNKTNLPKASKGPTTKPPQPKALQSAPTKT